MRSLNRGRIFRQGSGAVSTGRVGAVSPNGSNKSTAAKLYVLVTDNGNVDWVETTKLPSQACVLSGVNLSPNNSLRRVVNGKIYDHEEIRSHLIRRKNPALKKEFTERLAFLAKKTNLDQKEKEELFYLENLQELKI